jgi:DNA mismatch repair protein MutL
VSERHVDPESWHGEGHQRPERGLPVSSGGIRVLSTAVASRIAAGEVVERPASAVKELVENALDARARTIRIDIRGGGLELIRVADDGHGIPADHLWLACQRHATSKLPHDDLDGIRTLGFRGEALPSIAAVSELTLVSADGETGVGRRLTVRDGRVVQDQAAPRTRGTTVSVRSLFANMPARRHAVARVQTEVAHVGQVARRLALSAPGVRMALFTEDRLVFQTTGSGDLGATLVEIHGAGIGGSLVEVPPVEVSGARVSGIVAGADVTLPSRSGIHVLVNRRWVQPRAFVQILENAYRPVVPRGRHPIVVVSVDAPPDRVDVNIHPAKLEVRLHAERMIATEAGRLVKDVLGRRPAPLGFRPLTGEAALGLATAPHLAEAPEQYDVATPIVTPGLPPLTLKGQVQNRLILLEGEQGLYLVDQHRAHERILYEHLARVHGPSSPEPVALPEPIVIELRPAQIARFGHRLHELAAIGFDLESFGGRAFLLRSAPLLPGVTVNDGDSLDGLGEAADLGTTLLAAAEEEITNAGEDETWRDRLLVRLSCRTAVRRGRPLDLTTMRALVERLGNTPSPAVCPHGSPLLMHVSGSLLAKEFDWT